MNRIAFLTALLLSGAASGVQAAPNDCQKMGEMAASIMDVRQTGVPKEDLAWLLESGSAEQNAILIKLSNQAYGVEVFGNEEARLQAVLDFQEKAYQACVQGK